MSYYKILGFEKEPFSTSPDPHFFYLSAAHQTALTNLLIELRLRRGLSVILGDIGTGKSTLSRKLVQELSLRNDFIFSIILDPSFDNEYLFLTSLVRNFGIVDLPTSNLTILDFREILERFLFQKTVNENKTVVLIIDEAQKLTDASLELLRVLLNYETNEFKLLQLVLLGQLELYSHILNIPNFFDRISFKYTLNPLDLNETAQMIEFRIKQAGYKSNIPLFLDDAIREIYQYSKGYPRQITMLCHKALKSLILKNKLLVDSEIIRSLIEEETKLGWYNRNPFLQKLAIR
ncbi:MAG: AAA family ATPase [Candidatus Omnitrophica bacterium]|nr:AAA family ATPase [Candidatus Omnitrophota bacterium]